MAQTLEKKKALLPKGLKAEDVLADYRMAYQSRQASLLGRREVLTGKAKFGIFGDGKEVAQIAMARAAQPGDFRSGYYRDQTFMFAAGLSDIRKFFAQLYADTDLEHEPASGGRQMNGHYATRLLDAAGNWLDHTASVQSAADSSPTGSQMPRLVGLAQASKLYRENRALHGYTTFSTQGNEIAWGTIGDASTSEGPFWESLNAVGVLQVPMVMSVWDDNYGISVPIRYQTTKSSISELLAGYQPTKEKPGIAIHTVKGWDYAALIETYQKVATQVRKTHAPALIHVQEVTQPQGHSTSGSHERYKSPERLAWEQEYDCIAQMRQYILNLGLATEAELTDWEKEDKKAVATARKEAWEAYQATIQAERAEALGLIAQLAADLPGQAAALASLQEELQKVTEPFIRDLYVALRRALVLSHGQQLPARQAILNWLAAKDEVNHQRFSSQLLSEGAESPLNEKGVPAIYPAEPELVDGRQVVRACFDAALGRDPRVLAFGEDLGFLGDVNQGFEGLQEKYGELRVSDTGIREATILGQGIGLAMRGLRPIAEIQYLDYLLYALQVMSDDLATLRYRSAGGQKAPVIVRTRGHRLEGIWHSGSPMGMILGSLRGMHVLVPRNMTQAAGFYNTLLKGDDPALVIEVLNGYRLKEPMPSNLAEFCLPLGQVETLRTGTDITLVTYGSCCRIALEAADILASIGIELEVIDAQSLLPFDRAGDIARSLAKTNRLIVLDEDVPGGASAYILQQVLEVQNGYQYLDSKPVTITSKDHRPAYANDGDYFSKSQVEHILKVASEMMAEYDPGRYQPLY